VPHIDISNRAARLPVRGRLFVAWACLGSLLLLIGLASCGPDRLIEPVSSPSPTTVPHADRIRFGVVGQHPGVNVWALHDAVGGNYADYALRNEYWPRLYALAPPEFELTPRIAEGMPQPVSLEAQGAIGRVTLRSDLHWTDGTSLTAADVAFTANTAIRFELGFDWASYYPMAALDAVESDGPFALLYRFSPEPDAGAWQYGALLAPIAQRAYWEPRIGNAVGLLPSDELGVSITDTDQARALLQAEVDELAARAFAVQREGRQDRELENTLRRKQGDLDAANNLLSELRDEYADKIQAARNALYLLEAGDEPTLGAWMPAGREGEFWLNAWNEEQPFTRPNFDTAAYRYFPDEASAVLALHANEVDMLLTPDGISSASAELLANEPGVSLVTSPSSRYRFLLVNPTGPALSDPVLRSALACLAKGAARSSVLLSEHGNPVNTFAPNVLWTPTGAIAPCAGGAVDELLPQIVDALRSAGYSWERQPTVAAASSALRGVDGVELAPMELLVPDTDPLRVDLADGLRQAALRVGIEVIPTVVAPESIDYAIFSSRQYDLALIGWRLSAYPDYLCGRLIADGLQAPTPQMAGICGQLSSETDLDAARRKIDQLQKLMSEDAVITPLYAETIVDAFRNLKYPYAELLDGYSGVYGAPSLAVPAP